VKAGFVASLSRPGGNLTGVNMFSVELQAKRLGILHELIPPTMVIANLVDPNFPPTEAAVAEMEAAARILGRQILVLKTSSESDIDAALRPFCRCELERSSLARAPSSIPGEIK